MGRYSCYIYKYIDVCAQESTTTVISLADLFGKSEDEEQEDHSHLDEIQEVLQNLSQSIHVLFTISCLFPLLCECSSLVSLSIFVVASQK